MPLYEYHCPSCNSRFELLRSMNQSTEPATCPAGHARAERIVSLFAPHTAQENGAPTGVQGGGGCACSAGGTCGCRG